MISLFLRLINKSLIQRKEQPRLVCFCITCIVVVECGLLLVSSSNQWCFKMEPRIHFVMVLSHGIASSSSENIQQPG